MRLRTGVIPYALVRSLQVLKPRYLPFAVEALELTEDSELHSGHEDTGFALGQPRGPY